MNAWSLPTALAVGGVEYPIRTDYRAIIDIFTFYNDPDYEEDEKALICLRILYEDFDSFTPEMYDEALERACEFIDYRSSAGKAKNRSSPPPPVMDWEQDAPLILSAINHVAGKDIRTMDHLHWWSFMDYYMEIPRDSLFSTVLSIRIKKRKGKLEEWEKEFYRDNRDLIDIKRRESAEETAEREEWEAAIENLFGKRRW